MTSADRRGFLVASGVALGAALAGCSDDETPEDVPFGIENLTLTADEPDGYREFDEAETDRYASDETVWLYFEPVGAQTESVDDDEGRVQLTTTLRVDDPGGTELFEDETQVTQRVAEETDEDLFLFWNFRPPESADPGEYTATVGLVDEIGEERASAETAFTVEG